MSEGVYEIVKISQSSSLINDEKNFSIEEIESIKTEINKEKIDEFFERAKMIKNKWNKCSAFLAMAKNQNMNSNFLTEIYKEVYDSDGFTGKFEFSGNLSIVKAIILNPNTSQELYDTIPKIFFKSISINDIGEWTIIHDNPNEKIKNTRPKKITKKIKGLFFHKNIKNDLQFNL